MLERFKVILWDFDGVILNSNAVRDLGFEKVLADFPQDKVEELLAYHRLNGGLSRYHKFRYFYEQILERPITDDDVMELASRFSIIMKKLLTDKSLLINDAVSFIRMNHTKYSMHIVSGSDQNELRYLCNELELDSYFKTILGSPTPKIENVRSILNEHAYKKEDVVLIGDSINDKEAATINGISFAGYNNLELLDDTYIHNFENIGAAV